MRKFIIVIVALTTVVGSCARKRTNAEPVVTSNLDYEINCDFEDREGVCKKLNINTVKNGYARSGGYYTKTTEQERFSSGITYVFSDKLAGAAMKIYVDGWFNLNTRKGKAYLVTRVTRGEETVYWKGKNLVEGCSREFLWHPNSDTIEISGPITDAGNVLEVFIWNESSYDVSMDDLKVGFDVYGSNEDEEGQPKKLAENR